MNDALPTTHKGWLSTGFYFLIFICLNVPLKGTWDPLNFAETNHLSHEILFVEEFADLKLSVSEYVGNGWSSDEKTAMIMDLVALVRPKVCVEVGVFTGSTFFPLVETLSFLRTGMAYAIDSWSNRDTVRGISCDDPHYQWWSEVDMQRVIQSFIHSLYRRNILSHYVIMPIPSKYASAEFDRIDFLHLDGNFSEEGALEDVRNYLPKVPAGGYVLLSNIFIQVNGLFAKMPSLEVLLDECEVIAEIEGGNSVLFRKAYHDSAESCLATSEMF